MKRTVLTPKELLFVLAICFTIFISAFAIGWNYGYQGIVPSFSKVSDDANLIRSFNLVRDYFDGSIDIGRLVASLNDPNSYYVSKTEYEKLKAADAGQAVGIGVGYTLKENKPVIIEVFPDSPAFLAGIQAGDTIVGVDNKIMSELSNEIEVLNTIKGNVGEQSVFAIEGTDKKRRTVVIKRSSFEIPTFAYKIIDQNAAYLKVYQFSPTLPEDFKSIHQNLLSDKPERLIVDLRNNLGGDTQAAIFFVDQFIKQGILLRETWKNSTAQDISYASEEAPFPDMPIFVLVNGETSSAAEVVTAAMKDNTRGIIVGSSTFGKGTSGNFFELSDGSAIHLKIGKWFTPNDVWIDGSGITPDISVEDDAESEQDEVLTAALLAMGK